MGGGMRRTAALFLFLAAGTAAAPAPALDIRVDGKVLRKASGKLVLSLSSFELQGAREASFRNRRTGETRTLAVASVYEDISYTEALPPEVLDAFREDDWIPSVVWTIPDDLDAMNRRLSAIHEYQNGLRRGLGKALLEEGMEDVKVSSRLSLNKIEKFHRVAALVAGRILELGRESGNPNPFLYPVRIEVGYNPFGKSAARSPVEEVREVVYWEVHRTLTLQIGIDERFVEALFEGPTTLREFLPPAGAAPREVGEFVPGVTLAPEGVDGAVYLLRQGFDADLMKLVRLGRFADPFITDRPAVDAFVNRGTVAGVTGRRVALTFVPPFLREGETFLVQPGDGKGEIPVVATTPRPLEGYTLCAELPEEAAARIRPGMPVRRR